MTTSLLQTVSSYFARALCLHGHAPISCQLHTGPWGQFAILQPSLHPATSSCSHVDAAPVWQGRCGRWRCRGSSILIYHCSRAGAHGVSQEARKDVPTQHVGCVWVQSWLLSMAAEKPYSCLLAARRAAADGAPQQRRARQMRGRRLAGAAAAAWRHHPHEGPSATESALLVHLHEVFAAHALKPTWMAAAAWPVTLPQPFEACEVDDAVADVAKVMQRRWVPAMHPRCKHFFSASTIGLII